MKLVDENKHLRGLLLASEARIAELEHRLNKDSGNSSKPPSSDGFKKRKIELAKPRFKGRRSGGQRGHKGHHLKRSEQVTHIIDHRPDSCAHCGGSLAAVSKARVKSVRHVHD